MLLCVWQFARHFWAGAKPWRLGAPACLRYFDFLDAPVFAEAASQSINRLNLRVISEGACLPALHRKREALRSSLRKYGSGAKVNDGCGKRLSVTPFPFA